MELVSIRSYGIALLLIGRLYIPLVAAAGAGTHIIVVDPPAAAHPLSILRRSAVSVLRNAALPIRGRRRLLQARFTVFSVQLRQDRFVGVEILLGTVDQFAKAVEKQAGQIRAEQGRAKDQEKAPKRMRRDSRQDRADQSQEDRNGAQHSFLGVHVPYNLLIPFWTPSLSPLRSHIAQLTQALRTHVEGL